MSNPKDYSTTEIKQLIQKLASSDLDALNSAMKTLTESVPEVEKYLIESLSWKDNDVRKNAAWVLGLLCRKVSIQPLLKSMTLDQDIEVQLNAAWALRQFELVDMLPLIFDKLPMPQNLGNILYYLTSKSWKAKWYCTIIVAKKPTGKALTYLLDIVKDDNEMLIVRCSAIQSLQFYKHPELTNTLLELLDDFNPFIKIEVANMVCLKNIKEALPLLKRQCKSLNVDVRGNMITAIGLLSDKEVPEEVLEALSDQDDLVRINASMAVSEIIERLTPDEIENQKSTLYKYLEPTLKDKSQYVIRNTVPCLGMLGNEEIVDKLLALLKKETQPEILTQLTYALGILGHSKAYNQLIKLSKDSHWEVRFQAIKALGQLKLPKSYKILIKALQDPSNLVKEQAIYSLGLIENKKALKPLEKLLMQYPYDNRLKNIITNSMNRLLTLD